MSWWSKLFGRRASEPPYGLHPDNPILCGGGVAAEMDFLQRLRCPSGMPVFFERLGSLQRTQTEYLNRPGVGLWVSRGTERLIAQATPHDLPLDGYLIACECGEHTLQIFIDIYFRGPELPIDVAGWTLCEGVSPAEGIRESASCPYCGEELRTPQAKQCRHCQMDWHDPENVHRREKKST